MSKSRLVYSTEDGRIADSRKPSTRRKPQSQTPTIKNPAKQGVRIRRESKGRGGKTVCIIEGLELQTNELKALLKTLKSGLGCGGALKSGCLEIQGDHRDKLLERLAAEGYKAKPSGG